MTYYGASDLARSYRTVRGNTLKIAEEIPEDKYDYRPTSECRSAREILAHILVSSKGIYRAHAVRKIATFIGLDYPALVRERLEQEKLLSSASKAQLIQELRTDGENWGAFLDTVPEAELSVLLTFPEGAVPPAKSRFEMFLSTKEHEMHHRAQLMVFERLLGLVPHLTRDRQAWLASNVTR